jgi:hypothetical protein
VRVRLEHQAAPHAHVHTHTSRCLHTGAVCKRVTRTHGASALRSGPSRRAIKDQLAPSCGKEIFKLQRWAADDFRADPQLYEACQNDASTLCKGVKFGAGRVQACLVRRARVP